MQLGALQQGLAVWPHDLPGRHGLIERRAIATGLRRPLGEVRRRRPEMALPSGPLGRQLPPMMPVGRAGPLELMPGLIRVLRNKAGNAPDGLRRAPLGLTQSSISRGPRASSDRHIVGARSASRGHACDSGPSK